LFLGLPPEGQVLRDAESYVRGYTREFCERRGCPITIRTDDFAVESLGADQYEKDLAKAIVRWFHHLNMR
jgi:hypothetical protein